MPRLTPRQQLTERVAERLHERGFNDQAAYATAVLAVDAWYARNADAEFHALVCQEAMASIVAVIPAFASHMRAAFQQAMDNATALTQAMRPWLDMAEQMNGKANEPATPAIEFDASGLPVNTNPEFDTPIAPADRQGEPCIEEGCEDLAVPGTAFCSNCMPQPTAETQLMAVIRDNITGDTHEEPVPEGLDVADEVALADTGRRSIHLRPFNRAEYGLADDSPAPMFHMGVVGPVEVSRDSGETWEALPGVLSVEVTGSQPTPSDVIELTTREWHLSAARGLRRLGCSYAELAEMGRTGDFASGHHHSLWFNISGTIDREQLDRAEFVLDHLTFGPNPPELTDEEIAAAEANYPTDRITGAPHHFIINGDHSACGCGGHDPSCAIWNIPAWNHKATMCRIRRQLCQCTPRHTYSEPCPEYHENLADLVRSPVVGRTTEGDEIRGPAAG